MGVVQNHPNATAGVAGGAGLGTLVVWVLGLFGLDVSPEVASVIAGAVAGLVLFVGRNGVKGTWARIWGGAETA